MLEEEKLALEPQKRLISSFNTRTIRNNPRLV